ncbi:lipoyl(octanoyl) transferase LipB [Gottschalkia purinilytica]|uniref:Octanoyltransferase n=1 Tax=Gottschalkia purinilytica TaxID=1503 RepID=A0A0L0W7N2_GOTPU|nr:lipoyl(octanoyl) transferase LipB [Gottschalkia purinilytica]KNF07539.1 lipoyl(octanoyl) transferase LipB [Gottschalkia purinilytica]
MTKLNVLNLGQCSYEEALDIQLDLLKKRQDKEIEDTLILVEHFPVITLGKNAVEENILVSEEYLKSQNADIVKIGRGGDVTYHGPGQIVGYPIVNIKDLKLGIKDFVYKLEELFIQLLKNEYNIDAFRDDINNGVWIKNSKITAIGLTVKRWVTMHGFAFNVNTNLDHFNWIVPCGIQGRDVISLEKLLDHNVDFQRVNDQVLKYFCKIFGYDSFEEISLYK